MASKKPDFKKANTLANEILVASSTLVAFPVRVKAIVKEWSDIAIRPFAAAIKLGIDITAFGSKSAVLQCKEGRYIIFYNQEEGLPRIRFSLLHEFGHYQFGHKLKKYGEEEEDEYGRLEIEANCFAAQILMPEQVINELKSRGANITADFLMKYFAVSREAAQKRIETLGKCNYGWRSADEKFFDETILFKYTDFIDSILPKKNKYNSYYDEEEMQRERDSWDFSYRTQSRY